MTVDRAAAFAADLAAAPDALRRLLDAWDAPAGPAEAVPHLVGRPVRFLGLGSSRYAALVVAAALAENGRDVPVDWPSAPRSIGRDGVVFAISSSGRTAEVVAAASRYRAAGATVVAVTNAEASALADVADVTVPLLAGTELSGIACTSFRATVMALALATRIAEPDGLRRTVAALESSLGVRSSELEPRLGLLDGAETVDVIGDGRWMGALEQAALMLREAPRVRAAAWDTGEWLHTAVYTAMPGHRAILFGGTQDDDEVVHTIRRRGGEVILLGGSDPRSPIQVAIDALAHVEAIAAGLWSRTTAAGR